MQTAPSIKTITEPASEIRVVREADVVVVGGGPGGHAAAVSAARSGADTVLVERYGHLGGMATGGLVIMVPHLSDGTERIVIAGQVREWSDRLDVRGAIARHSYEDMQKMDKATVEQWRRFHHFFALEDRLHFGFMVDPEILKCVLNDMVEESGVHLYLHSWGTRAIVEKNEVQGVIFESKSGRQAILGKVVIDATGDGDLLTSAGAAFDRRIDPSLRIATVAVVFRLGNVDTAVHDAFKRDNPKQYQELMDSLVKVGGFPAAQRSSRDDVLWVSNWVRGLDILKVEDLTRAEVKIRKGMLITYDYFKKHIPGFAKSFIMDTASQTGTRGSRRVIGEYTVTEEDWKSGRRYDDTIALLPELRRIVSEEYPLMQVPYRALVPKTVENLLVAGRSFSSDDITNNDFNLIPHCTLYGMAAGTAAALSVKAGVKVRKVNISDLKENLIKQNVILPENLPPSRMAGATGKSAPAGPSGQH